METIRVLLVDDHPIVRAGIRMLLETAPDIQVVGEADRGNCVVQMIAQLQPDVLLLDMELPDISGLEVAGEVGALENKVPILALSAHDDERYIMNLLAGGAAGYLTKEEALTTIVDAVRGVARGEEGWFSRRAAARIAQNARRDQSTRSARIQSLTDREKEVLALLITGMSNQEIGDKLSIAERTVRYHLTNIYGKLEVTSRSEAIYVTLSEE